MNHPKIRKGKDYFPPSLLCPPLIFGSFRCIGSWPVGRSGGQGDFPRCSAWRNHCGSPRSSRMERELSQLAAPRLAPMDRTFKSPLYPGTAGRNHVRSSKRLGLSTRCGLGQSALHDRDSASRSHVRSSSCPETFQRVSAWRACCGSQSRAPQNKRLVPMRRQCLNLKIKPASLIQEKTLFQPATPCNRLRFGSVSSKVIFACPEER